MKIVLIGFMGSGKSTVAKIVAEKLLLPCYEIDDYTTKLTKMPITQFVEKYGEAKFRKLEKDAISELSNIKDGVISTGGGSILDPENQKALFSNNAVIIYLKTSFEAVKQRLAGNLDRPLFKDIKKAELLYQERAPLYERLATVIIDTDNLSVDEVSRRIVTLSPLFSS